jgi:hypothetical protein
MATGMFSLPNRTIGTISGLTSRQAPKRRFTFCFSGSPSQEALEPRSGRLRCLQQTGGVSEGRQDRHVPPIRLRAGGRVQAPGDRHVRRCQRRRPIHGSVEPGSVSGRSQRNCELRKRSGSGRPVIVGKHTFELTVTGRKHAATDRCVDLDALIVHRHAGRQTQAASEVIETAGPLWASPRYRRQA